jgi:triosephosphate isomerase
MTDSRRAPIIAGNWKMHKTIQESVDFINQLGPSLTSDHPAVYLAVPFTAIYPAAEAAHPFSIIVGAQNMNSVAEGAFTGEIAGKMIKEAGAQFVILGHSERRRLFNETSQIVNQKVQRALKDGLDIILCVGETAEERDAGKTEEILKEQIEVSLQNVVQEQFAHIILAYEPIWAIGTSQTASPEVATKMHAHAREVILAKWGEEVSAHLRILYGGSVKVENANELMSQPDIDGLLVGGASLSVASFRKIIEYQNFNSGVST